MNSQNNENCITLQGDLIIWMTHNDMTTFGLPDVNVVTNWFLHPLHVFHLCILFSVSCAPLPVFIGRKWYIVHENASQIELNDQEIHTKNSPESNSSRL